MDKVGMKSTQALPLWERNKPSRGHRSAVDGALKAHRQRSMERQQRTLERLNSVNEIQNDFFPGPQLDNYSPLNTNQNYPVNTEIESFEAPLPQGEMISNQTQVEMAPVEQTIPMDPVESERIPVNPRQMEDLYNEAQLGSVKNQALAEVGQEIENPENGPVDDIPKGSYVDYEV